MTWIITGEQKNNWTPADIDTALWLDAADASTITESGGAVSQWDDKSGNGRSVSQSDASYRPSTNTRTINGVNAIECNPASATEAKMLFTTSSVFSGTPNVLIAQVVLFDSFLSTSDRASQISFGQGTSIAFAAGSQGYSARYNDGNEVYTSGTTGVPIIQIGTYPAGGQYQDARMYINGLELSRTSGVNDSNTINLLNGFSVGGGAIGVEALGTRSEALDGLIGEIIAVQSLGSRQKLEGYLAHKWGLTANLPADHPYKTAVPVP